MQVLVSGHSEESNIYIPGMSKDFTVGYIKRLLNYPTYLVSTTNKNL